MEIKSRRIRSMNRRTLKWHLLLVPSVLVSSAWHPHLLGAARPRQRGDRVPPLQRMSPELMLWTAPPPARKCHGCGRRLRLPRFGGAIHAIDFDNRSRYRQVGLSSAWRRCGRPGGDPSAKTSLRGKRRFSDVDVERARLLQQYALHRASPDAERLRCLEIDGQLEFGRLLDR